MAIDQLLLMLIVAACPGSLLIGAVATLLVIRTMGIRWPWEQPRKEQGQDRFGRWDRKNVRVGAKYIVSVVLREREKGWIYTGQTEDGPGIWDVHFIRRVE